MEKKQLRVPLRVPYWILIIAGSPKSLGHTKPTVAQQVSRHKI